MIDAGFLPEPDVVRAGRVGDEDLVNRGCGGCWVSTSARRAGKIGGV